MDRSIVDFICSCDEEVAALISSGDAVVVDGQDIGDSAVVSAIRAADNAYRWRAPPRIIPPPLSPHRTPPPRCRPSVPEFGAREAAASLLCSAAA